MSGETGGGLTVEEREKLLDILRDVEHIGVETGTWEQGRVLAHVERILSARLTAERARVETNLRALPIAHVLYDPQQPISKAGQRILAALHPDPSEAA